MRTNRITNNLSRFATRGSFGLRRVLCLRRNAVAFVVRCSLLNWALVRDWHQRSKFRCLSVLFSSFTPEWACLSRSFRWHYVRSVSLDFTVYGF